MPSREELLAKLMGTMQAPVAKLVRTLNEVPGKFVRTLAAVRDQKEKAASLDHVRHRIQRDIRRNNNGNRKARNPGRDRRA